MKLRFDTQAATWLHARITQLVTLAGSREDSRAVSRTASKMRYKFHGAPTIVWLNQKERTLLGELVNYTMENSPSPEERAIAGRAAKVLVAHVPEAVSE